MFIYKMKV